MPNQLVIIPLRPSNRGTGQISFVRDVYGKSVTLVTPKSRVPFPVGSYEETLGAQKLAMCVTDVAFQARLRELDQAAVEHIGTSDVLLIPLVKKKGDYDPIVKATVNAKTKVVIMGEDDSVVRRDGKLSDIKPGCTVKARFKISCIYVLSNKKYGVSLFAKNVAVWPPLSETSSESEEEWDPLADEVATKKRKLTK